MNRIRGLWCTARPSPRPRAGRLLNLLGEPRGNVLVLNLALDRQLGRPLAVAP